MEMSLSSLSFNGSIVEAIAEAKMKKKLFVVYISGGNLESSQLETSTWSDKKVADSILKYCILLHISEGSPDVAHFSAIYPQKPAPCITAVGYNGLQLWQKEGFIGAEVLASSIEKAWLSIHIQETTASFLTAALASKKSQQVASGSSEAASFEQGSSSRMDIPSSSIENNVQSSGPEPMVQSETKHEYDNSKSAFEERDSKLSDKLSSGSESACEFESANVKQSASTTETPEKTVNPVKVDLSNSGADHVSSGVITSNLAPEETSNVIDHSSGINKKTSQVTADESKDSVHDGMSETREVEKAVVIDASKSGSNDVFLNIRLPDGAMLQKKFSVANTLQTVKDYVDENYTSSLGSYDLAIPYPRKTFKDQDLEKTLTELGLFNRQALVVVPHNWPTGYHRVLSHNQTNDTNDVGSLNGGSEGYFAFARRILSYINPFSYLGGVAGASDSQQEPETNMLQCSSNPALQNNLGGIGRPYTLNASRSQSTATGRNNSASRQQNTSRFGSNIHTLRHDEDDGRFSDRNAFWNGNSTQYGGDDDRK